jgi:hypothetical protein
MLLRELAAVPLVDERSRPLGAALPCGIGLGPGAQREPLAGPMQRVAITVGATPAKWLAPPQLPSLHKASGKPGVRTIWNACRTLTVHAILRVSPRPQSFRGMHLGDGELSS